MIVAFLKIIAKKDWKNITLFKLYIKSNLN